MIVITVALVLFAGISSPAIAEEQIPSQLESAANPNGDSPQSLEYVELLKNECARNGGPEAYDIFKQSEESLSECVFETLGALKPANGIVGTPPRDTEETLLENWCRQLSRFASCIRNVTEKLKGCYEPKDREAVNVNSNAIGGLVDFLCTTSEENHIEKLAANGVAECSNSEAGSVRNCAYKIFHNYVLDGATGQGRLQPPQDVTEKTIIGNYLPCISKAMTKCETPGPADVVNSLYHSFIQQSP